MKLKAIALGAALSMVALPAAAEFSGYGTLTSDYDYRGISQTAKDFAIQGGLDYAHSSGFYASIWGSSLDWGPDASGSIEIDYIVGFTRNFGETDWAWDVGLLFYTYPSMSGANFTEIYAGISYDIWNVKVSYSDDFAGVNSRGWYVDGGFDYGWDNGFNVFGYLGYSFGDAFDTTVAVPLSIVPSTPIGFNDYFNFGLGVGWTYENMTLDARVVGTDLDEPYKIKDDVFNTETRAIFSLTVSFP